MNINPNEFRVPAEELEAHLHRNGTRIIKFFLHMSKDERADISEREQWDHYMQAYVACLRATSTADAPWYVVPADDKKNARLIISQIILDTLNQLRMQYSEVDTARREELESIRKCLLRKD